MLASVGRKNWSSVRVPGYDDLKVGAGNTEGNYTLLPAAFLLLQAEEARDQSRSLAVLGLLSM